MSLPPAWYRALTPAQAQVYCSAPALSLTLLCPSLLWLWVLPDIRQQLWLWSLLGLWLVPDWAVNLSFLEILEWDFIFSYLWQQFELCLTSGCYWSSGSILGWVFRFSPMFGHTFGSGHCSGGCFGSAQALGLPPPQEAALTWPLFGPWLWLWPHLGLWLRLQPHFHLQLWLKLLLRPKIWLNIHLGLLLCLQPDLWLQFWFWICIGLWHNFWPDIGQMLCQQLDGRSQLWL